MSQETRLQALKLVAAMRMSGLTSLQEKRMILDQELPAKDPRRIDLLCEIFPAIVDEIKGISDYVSR